MKRVGFRFHAGWEVVAGCFKQAVDMARDIDISPCLG